MIAVEGGAEEEDISEFRKEIRNLRYTSRYSTTAHAPLHAFVVR